MLSTNIGSSHHGQWSVYFNDPEGNRVELYVDTEWYVGQPFRDELDFNLTDEEIIERTREIVHQYPTAEPINQWRQRVADSIVKHMIFASLTTQHILLLATPKKALR